MSCSLLVASAATAAGATDDARGGAWTGLEVRDLEGVRWTASDLLGHVVLLDFWASWCAPCLAELPLLRRVHEELADHGVLVLGVAVDGMQRAELRSWLARHGVEWPQIREATDLSGALARRFGVEAVPRTVVIDRRGAIVAVDLRGEALRTVLRDLARTPGPRCGEGVAEETVENLPGHR